MILSLNGALSLNNTILDYVLNELSKAQFTMQLTLCACISIVLGGCPFHGRVERDEIPTRESPPKQSGTR